MAVFMQDHINWQNWQDDSKEFKYFTEKITQRWIQEGFTKKRTKKWIKTGLFSWSNSYAYFLRNIKNLTPWQYSELNGRKKNQVRKEFDNWFSQGNWALCTHCLKRISKDNCRNDRKDLNYCSYSCRKQSEIYGQKWLDKWYPVNGTCLKRDDKKNFGKTREQITELNISRQGLTGSLSFSDFTKLEELYCYENKLTSLNASNLTNLKSICCSNNQLTNLKINGLSNLENLRCSVNYLTDIESLLTNLNSNKLISLSLYGNNFSKSDLSLFSKFINLEMLRIGSPNETHPEGLYNHFVGSLESFRNMNKLSVLWINDTDVKSGLEYLPSNVNDEVFSCESKISEAKVQEIFNELSLCEGRIKGWRETHPELMIKAWGENWTDIFYYNNSPLVITNMPDGLFNEDEEREEFGEVNYQNFALRDKHPFFWEEEDNSSNQLPIKLYHTPTNTIIWTKKRPNIISYAILSYVWGDLFDSSNLTTWDYFYQNEEGEIENKQMGVSPKDNAIGTPKQGVKALKKAIATCQLLGIEYLWMDQICIDQFNNREVNQEVPKMRQYYGNAKTTLIPINGKVNISNFKYKDMSKEDKRNFTLNLLKMIFRSEWFTRSWTFQEGLLSKQTIFMFDDALIDGRVMAKMWAILRGEQEFEDKIGSGNELDENLQTFITPLGWTYYRKISEHKIKNSLGLFQALEAIKNRDKTVPIDGIYSILGLLPYSHDEGIKVSYKPRICKGGGDCSGEFDPSSYEGIDDYKLWGVEDKYCKHTEEKKWPIYVKKDFDSALINIMEVAVKNGYVEPLSWMGSRRSEPSKWRIPKMDKKGTTDILSGLEIHCEPEDVKFTDNGIELIGCYYEILGTRTPVRDIYNSSRAQEGNRRENIYYREVRMPDRSCLALKGVRETLEEIKKGDFLVIPNKKQWKSNKQFVILVPGKNNPNCSIDILVNKGEEKIFSDNEKKIFIDMVNQEIILKSENPQNYEQLVNQTKEDNNQSDLVLSKEEVVEAEDNEQLTAQLEVPTNN